ncbi:hypothetical protein C8Q76DRAFT_212767 [Earliella scabrosa]|nr:hypothetical protein C8Q76DRAFT_212767 [Earliella scabrosa]
MQDHKHAIDLCGCRNDSGRSGSILVLHREAVRPPTCPALSESGLLCTPLHQKRRCISSGSSEQRDTHVLRSVLSSFAHPTSESRPSGPPMPSVRGRARARIADVHPPSPRPGR